MSREKQQEDWENELFDIRAREQKASKDYAYEENGKIETCSDCGSPINSHDHCPRCDY
jgi:transcription initiation factor IIE alpha subunit